MVVNSKKNDVINELLRLADGFDGKSNAAKLRVVIEPVELALSSGVSRKKVLETISESLGISMTMKTFEKNLYRIRKERKSVDNVSKNGLGSNDYSDNSIENKSIINDQAAPINKENLRDKAGNEISNSEKYFTPKRIRSIRESALNELDNDSAKNYE